jgi:hypothetical protein
MTHLPSLNGLDEDPRPLLKACIEQDLTQVPLDVSVQLSIACANLAKGANQIYVNSSDIRLCAVV